MDAAYLLSCAFRFLKSIFLEVISLMPISSIESDIQAIGEIDSIPMILRMVKHITGMRFAAVARVTDSKWVACAVDDSIQFGLPVGGELVLESTICYEIRQHRLPVVFGHASQHPVYSQHHARLIYPFESYVSIPIIRSNGAFFGTLCAIDPAPHYVETPAVLETLKLFAQLVAASLDMQNSMAITSKELIQVKEASRLRDQFIAILGHDLRTPLSAVRMSTELLETKVAEPAQRRLVNAIRMSAQRMSALIENVLDFARGQLGNGVPVKRTAVSDLGIELERIVTEVQQANPTASLQSSVYLPIEVDCDPIRIGQLLSNLLSNAVVHGAEGLPITVEAKVEGHEIVISVSNQGAPIPPELMPLLFQPYTRSESDQYEDGLGLGLYISYEIVKGHNGSISVSSTVSEGTRFTARFPLENSIATL